MTPKTTAEFIAEVRKYLIGRTKLSDELLSEALDRLEKVDRDLADESNSSERVSESYRAKLSSLRAEYAMAIEHGWRPDAMGREISKLRAENAELLESCKVIMAWAREPGVEDCSYAGLWEALEPARAALKKAGKT